MFEFKFLFLILHLIQNLIYPYLFSWYGLSLLRFFYSCIAISLYSCKYLPNYLTYYQNIDHMIYLFCSVLSIVYAVLIFFKNDIGTILEKFALSVQEPTIKYLFIPSIFGIGKYIINYKIYILAKASNIFMRPINATFSISDHFTSQGHWYRIGIIPKMTYMYFIANIHCDRQLNLFSVAIVTCLIGN